MFHSLSTTQFLHPDPSSILLASSNPSSAKNFLHALLNNLSLSPLFRCGLSFPLGVPLFRDSARVGAPQEIPLRGKTSFFFRIRRRDKYFPPQGESLALKIFALPKRVTLLRALRALRASFVISVRALGRGESAQYKYLNRADYIFTYRFPSPVGCVSPLLHPMAQRRPPCRTEPRSEAAQGGSLSGASR